MAAISGTVFLDGNLNGVKDATEVGYPFVRVNAYAPGAVAPTANATTNNSGTYSITGLAAGQYRIEFVTPQGYYPTAYGAASQTSIRFTTEGTANLNYGIQVPGTCGTDPDPRMIGVCGLVNSGSISVVSWLYASQSFPQDHWNTFGYNGVVHPHSNDIPNADVGVPWAMARKPGTQLIAIAPMSSPLTSVFGSGGVSGPTAIYLASYEGAGKTYLSNKKLIRLADFGYTLAAQSPVTNGVTNRFGEYGLGGLDFSPDGKFLYAINLGKRNILKIDVSNVNYASLPATAPGAAQISEIALPTTYAGFTDGIDGFYRPTTMIEHAGSIFIGGTFDGSKRGDNSAVRVVVLKMNLAANTFTEVFSYDPTLFLAGNLSVTNAPQTRWTAGPDSSTSSGDPAGPIQPVVAGMAIDDYGALNIGIQDRAVYGLDSSNQTGYLLSTWPQANGTFVIENNNARGPLSSPSGTTLGQTNADATYGSGPGGDWFYDQSWGHPYLFSGGVLNVPGTGRLLAGYTDALDVNAFGVRYLDTSNGRIKGGIHLGGGKQFAIVGVDAVCEIGPIEIGNYVWRDNNNNGMQDAGEPAISGVTVKLLDASGTEIGSAVTDAAGYYIFSSDDRTDTAFADYNIAALTQNSNFTIRIPNISGGSAQAPLAGLFLAAGNAGSNDLIDSDATSSGVNAQIAVVTGVEGQNNHSYDVGFGTTPLAVCDITDLVVTPGACNDNSTPNDTADDYYTASVTVTFADKPVSGDLVLSGVALHSTNSVTTVAVASTTSATTHTFAGVRLKANGVANAITATFSADPACTMTINAASVDNCSVVCPVFPPVADSITVACNTAVNKQLSTAGGVAPYTYAVTGGALPTGLSLTAGGLLSGDPTVVGTFNVTITVTDDDGCTGLINLEIIVSPCYSLGNLVWNDNGAGGGTLNDGIRNGAEPALANVLVELLDGSGSPYNPGTGVVTTTTNANGYYRFDNLPAGNYCVRVAASNFAGAAVLNGFISSGGQSTDFTVAGNNKDHGAPVAGAVTSTKVTLGASNPTGDKDAGASGAGDNGPEGDANDNLVVDFGFFVVPANCLVSNIAVTPGACNDNGTPANSADDYYTADVTVSYSNKPASGNLVLSGAALHSSNSVTTVPVGSTGASSHVFNGVRLKANGAVNTITATFSADVACTLSVDAPSVNNCSVPPCDITDLVVTPGACNDNGTPENEADDYFTSNVSVTFTNKPATGNLVLSGVSLHSTNSVSTVAVGSTTSATTHNFVGVRLKANGVANAITATFSADPACTMTVNTSVVPECSTPPAECCPQIILGAP